MAKVSVMGAGSWGLGLAILLNNNGQDVKVWSVFPEEIKVLASRCLFTLSNEFLKALNNTLGSLEVT